MPGIAVSLGVGLNSIPLPSISIPAGNFIVAGTGNRLVAGSGNPLKAG